MPGLTISIMMGSVVEEGSQFMELLSREENVSMVKNQKPYGGPFNEGASIL